MESALAVVFAVVSACGQAPPPAPGSTTVELVDLPAFFGHETVTHVVASDPAGVTRVELYLDDMRVGAAEFAPFDVHWDASAFDDGPHRLRAVAYVADGRTGSSEVVIQIDHVSPLVDLPALTATRDEPFVVTATDAAGVAQIVILRQGQPLATLIAAPYQFPWPGGVCGAVELHIVATDRLGNQIDVVKTVDAVDTHDLDCDGDAAIRFGGADCDDTTVAFGPHAPDPGGSLVDFNCDGLPGVDADHDGVPSVATSGTDCDDASSAAHGDWLGWTGVALDLGPAAPAPAFVAVDAASDHQVLVFVGGDGRLRFASAPLSPRAPVSVEPEVVADGVDVSSDRHPAVIGGGGNDVAIAFFADAALKLATRGTTETSWTITEIDPGAGSRLRRVEIARGFEGALHLVYEAGGDASPQLSYATNTSGTWSIETVPDSSPAQDARIGVGGFFGGPVLLYKNATALRRAERLGSSWLFSTLFDDRQRISQHVVASDGTVNIDAVFVVTSADHDEIQRASFQSFPLPVATVPDRVTQLVVNGGAIVAQLTSRTDATASVGVLSSTGTFLQKLQVGEIVGATRSLRASLSVILGASGQPLRLATATGAVFSAPDPAGDRDVDCDGVP